jgi:Flp pilus assembly protein TadB
MCDRVRDALWPAEERWKEEQAGLSKLAITVILVAVGVGLTLAVVAILGPAIMNLANQTGGQIESVPMDWGP